MRGKKLSLREKIRGACLGLGSVQVGNIASLVAIKYGISPPDAQVVHNAVSAMRKAGILTNQGRGVVRVVGYKGSEPAPALPVAEARTRLQAPGRGRSAEEQAEHDAERAKFDADLAEAQRRAGLTPEQRAAEDAARQRWLIEQKGRKRPSEVGR